MMDWIDWICDRLGYTCYDIILEDYTEEELEKLYDEYDEYVLSESEEC